MNQNLNTPGGADRSSVDESKRKRAWVTQTWETILTNLADHPQTGILQFAERMKAFEERFELERKQCQRDREAAQQECAT